MARIVITEFMDGAAVEKLSAAHDVLYDPDLVEDRARLIGLMPGVEALIVRNRTEVNAELLAASPDLRAVGRLGVGLDNIALDRCKAQGVEVFPATGANALAVAEYVITAALILLRGAWLGSDDVAGGGWPRQQMIGREIAGKTLGLVGFGDIAQITARLGRGLGMEVAAFDPFRLADDPAWEDVSRYELPDLYARSDVISLHTPLTDETRRMIGQAAISRMKPDAIIINAARGGVVDESALIEALRAGRLAGAALDVFEAEPLTAEDGERFKGLNVLLTPHIGGVTTEANVRVSNLIADRILEFLG